MSKGALRVVHVFGILNYGGAETMIMNIFREIDRENVQFDFVVHSDEKGEYDNEVKKLGGRIFVCPRYSPKNHFRYLKWWDEFCSQNKGIILHSHIRSTASLYLPIAKKHGIKTIIHSHSTSNGRGLSSVVKRVFQFPLRYQADYLFACSKNAGEWLYGKGIEANTKYRFFPNSINVSLYVFNEKDRNTCRKKIEIDNQKVYIHIGRFHPAKNHLFLLDVFSEIKRLEKDSLLILVGDGETRAEIEGKISDLGIVDSVLLLGKRGDVPELLKAADVFLFPSRWEGLPLTVIEAQAAGLPCLVSSNITSDVRVTDLVINLDINDPMVWAEKAIALDTRKKDVSSLIRSAGYDVQESAEWLQDFYYSITE